MSDTTHDFIYEPDDTRRLLDAVITVQRQRNVRDAVEALERVLEDDIGSSSTSGFLHLGEYDDLAEALELLKTIKKRLT